MPSKTRNSATPTTGGRFVWRRLRPSDRRQVSAKGHASSASPSRRAWERGSCNHPYIPLLTKEGTQGWLELDERTFQNELAPGPRVRARSAKCPERSEGSAREARPRRGTRRPADRNYRSNQAARTTPYSPPQ